MTKSPLVPIAADHVGAALSWREMSVADLITATKESQQTVDAIVRGVTSRCREDRRNLIAEKLDVPSLWLSGQMRLASVRPWDPEVLDPSVAAEAQLWMVPHLAPDRIVLTDQAVAYDLACWDTSRRITKAWSRDIEGGDARASTAYESISQPGAPEWMLLRKAVERALSTRGWRHYLFGLQAGHAQFGSIDSTELFEGGTEVALSLGKAINRLLQPWYDELLPINYEVLAATVSWMATGMLTPLRQQRLVEAVSDPRGHVFQAPTPESDSEPHS